MGGLYKPHPQHKNTRSDFPICHIISCQILIRIGAKNVSSLFSFKHLQSYVIMFQLLGATLRRPSFLVLCSQR